MAHTEHVSEVHKVVEQARELGPEFIAAWLGWLVHSFVHSATHHLRHAVRFLIKAMLRK